MAGRNRALATAFLFLVFHVLMPQAAFLGKLPRFKINPKIQKPLRNFFRDHASDMANLYPGQSDESAGASGNNYDPSEPGGGSNNGGRSQAAATTAGKYIYSFDVGTPPQRVSGALDISSELVWTQCACPNCGPAAGTLFDPLPSSTMNEVPCTNTTCQQFVQQTCDSDVTRCLYKYTYNGGMAGTIGYLATETFTFDSDPIDDVVFGCGLVSVGEYLGGVSGMIGLSRGPLSLVSQLQAGRFSYYFAPDDSVASDSFIHFGDDATPRTSRAQSIPLLASNAHPNLYYVGLSGIQVDGHDLAIPPGTFDLHTTDGSSGVILSITIPVTFLDEVAYKVARDALMSKINLPTADGSSLGLDLCYTSQSMATATIPEMALVFDGGAVMELETWNYFYMDSVTGLECLTIVPSTAGGGSLLGNLIQTGTHMIYDIDRSTLTFESLEQASGTPSNSSPPKSSAPPSLRISPVTAVNFVWVMVYILYWVVAI